MELIISETKSKMIQDTSSLSKEDADFIATHFAARKKSEEEFFGEYDFPEDVPVWKIKHGEINSLSASSTIKEIAPDMILLFGTSIIRDPLLKNFSGRIINLHLGLSPYYKGSATNLFPYYFNEPECVGASFHLATSEVDAGAVLHQMRPEISVSDSLHSIGNKTILKAGEVLPEVVESYFGGNVTPIQQDDQGRICRIKDLTPAVLRKIYENFEQGMIQNYLKDKTRRDAEKPIVEC